MGRNVLAVAAVAGLALVGSSPSAGQAPGGPACPSKVMAFYYGWYGGPPEWRHWATATDDPRFAHDPNTIVDSGPQYHAAVKRDIASTNYPTLGPYGSRDASTVMQHLDWARDAGIDVLISSWWGPGSYEDRSLAFLLDAIEASGSPVRVAVYLEAWALFHGGQLQPGFFLDGRNFTPDEREAIREKAADWIAYLIRTYGDRPGLFQVEKGAAAAPVVFVYFSGLFFPQEWDDIFARVRAKTGRDAFYQADVEGFDPQGQVFAFDGTHVYQPAPFTAEGGLSLAARLLDPEAAVVFPGSGASDQATVGSDYRALATEARAAGRSWAATVIPGFDDRRIRSPSFYVSRDRGTERTYDYYWRVALQSRPDWVLLTSFNEWHEGSEIEPSVEYGSEFLRRTRDWADRVHACAPATGAGPASPPTQPGAARIRLAVHPRRAEVGRRTRFSFRARVGDFPVRDATVRFAGRSARTGRRGRAVFTRVLRRPRLYRARASKAGLGRGQASVRAVARADT